MRRFVAGNAEMRSPPFSRVWRLRQNGTVLAIARRSVRARASTVDLPDGTNWVVAPAGWGVVQVLEDDVPIVTATRVNPMGRFWDLTSSNFNYELRARSMARRRWIIGQGGAPIAELRGGILSFNRLAIRADLPVPVEAIMAAWHLIVRAWEAASQAVRPALLDYRIDEEAT